MQAASRPPPRPSTNDLSSPGNPITQQSIDRFPPDRSIRISSTIAIAHIFAAYARLHGIYL